MDPSGRSALLISHTLPGGTLVLAHAMPSPATALDFCGGTWLAVGTADGTVLVLDLATGVVRTSWQRPEGVRELAYSRPDRVAVLDVRGVLTVLAVQDF